MRFLKADIIFPIYKDPVPNGTIIVDDKGTIIDLLTPGQVDYEIPELEKYKGILCPGFVNTHCHLELSWAKDLISEKTGLDIFLRNLNILRHSSEDYEMEKTIEYGVEALYNSGTVAVGDIANSTSTLSYKKSSKLQFHTFAEVFASDPNKAEQAFSRISILAGLFRESGSNSRVSITPHSTYSLSSELFQLIGSLNDNIISIHHQENYDENSFFFDGTGPIAGRRQMYNPGIRPFKPTGKRPLESISHFFRRNQKMLLVHNTVTEEEDIHFSEKYFQKTAWCLCPNANLFIENKLPNLQMFRRNNCVLTIGTDSLASNHQLSILEELKTLSDHFPEVPINELFKWATLNGAEFLGFDQLGSFAKGKNPGVVLIDNVNLDELKLHDKSNSRLLVEPLP
jgi:aminodeoxyfutalosine deaminase